MVKVLWCCLEGSNWEGKREGREEEEDKEYGEQPEEVK